MPTETAEEVENAKNDKEERDCKCKWVTMKQPDGTNKSLPIKPCYKETCKYWRDYDKDRPDRYSSK